MNDNTVKKMRRRKFLKVTGITLGASAVACCGLGYLATTQPKIDFIEDHYQGKTDMNQRILVTYASKAGSTGEVARAIGEVLTAKGATVDVTPVNGVANLQDYQAVIIGSAIRMGRWMPEAKSFVETNQAYLRQVPTAYFNCGLGLREESEKTRGEALGYMDSVCSIVEPVSRGAFAGKLDYSKLSFLEGLIMKAMGDQPGDFRPWETIRAWAESLKLS